MTIWTVVIVLGLVGLLVALYFGTKKNMDEGLTPPGPIDSTEQFDDFSGRPEPSVHRGESEYETIAEDQSTEDKGLGHG